MQDLFDLASAKAEGRTWHEHSEIDKGHGRIETRRCVVCHDLSAIAPVLQDWPGGRSVLLVQSTRQPVCSGRFGPHSTVQTPVPSWRYYICSEGLDAQAFNATIRAHWSIENNCHWVLDVNYREDARLIRRDHGPHSMATAAHRAEPDQAGRGKEQPKKAERKRMGWSYDDLQALFGLTLSSTSQPKNQGAG